MDAKTWIVHHKMVAALFGAAAAGFVLYSFINRKSSSGGTASPVVGGSASAGLIGSGSPQYLVPVVQNGSDPNPTPATPAPVQSPLPSGTATSPVSNIPTPSTPPIVPTTGIQPPPAAATIAANPYTVGTRVTSHEAITQSVYDPLYNGYLDLTSKGGIYGGGVNVSGSAYNPAWNGSGRLALINGGADVQEYNSAGKLVGTFKVGK